MQLGMIGLGRMGSNMVRRLEKAGQQCVVHDVHADAIKPLAERGAVPATTLDELVSKLTPPRRHLADGAGGGRRPDDRAARR